MMRRISSIVWLLMFGLSACKTTYHAVSPKKFTWYYKTRKINKILVDTRPKERYKASNLPDSKHVPLDSPNLKEQVLAQFERRPRDVWVLFVYAHTKKDTDAMLDQLKKVYTYHWPLSGPTAIYYLDGGFVSIQK